MTRCTVARGRILCNSKNYHPRGAVDDPMHCCPMPSAPRATVHRVIHSTSWVIVFTVAQKGMKLLFTVSRIFRRYQFDSVSMNCFMGPKF